MPEILTNKYGLSQCWVDAAINDPYDRGEADYSVTELLGPPQQARLMERHEYREDVTDKIWAILGNSVHGLLERMGGLEKGVLSEQRHFIKVQVDGKTFVVSGAVDRTEPQTGAGYHLKDFKISKVWTAKKGLKDDWKWQTNIYRVMAEQKGMKVDKISVEMLCKDWDVIELIRARQKGEFYPESQIHVFDVPLVPAAEVLEFIKERIRIHEASKQLKDNKLPECSDEERWCRDSRYIVRKATSDKALPKAGYFESFAEAEEWRSNRKDKDDCVTELKPGKSVRCERFCSVNMFCHQYRMKINPRF